MGSVTEIRERLAREDANFQRLKHKHRELEQRLQDLQDRRYLSEEEKLEEIRLKKLKLALKDEMEQIVRRTSH
jgi:uncharacterized protein YdcH (DUF465 family)